MRGAVVPTSAAHARASGSARPTNRSRRGPGSRSPLGTRRIRKAKAPTVSSTTSRGGRRRSPSVGWWTTGRARSAVTSGRGAHVVGMREGAPVACAGGEREVLAGLEVGGHPHVVAAPHHQHLDEIAGLCRLPGDERVGAVGRPRGEAGVHGKAVGQPPRRGCSKPLRQVASRDGGCSPGAITPPSARRSPGSRRGGCASPATTACACRVVRAVRAPAALDAAPRRAINPLP